MRKSYFIMPSALLLSAFSTFGFSSMPASAQSAASPSAASTAAPSCATTVITVNSADQGDVFPAGINKSGTVVGLFQDLSSLALTNSGFQWSGGTGQLYNYPGASETWLSSINDAGLELGSYSNSSGQWFGFYLKNGQTKSFSVAGSYDTFPSGLNNHGAVVGSYDTFAGGPNVGFEMNGSTVTTIQYPGAVNTYPLAINDEGAIVGYYYDGTTEHGFLEYQNSYSKLEPAGASSSFAFGINNGGEIVGEYRPSVNADGEGFTYLNGKDVSAVYPTATYTELRGVNSVGDRVGDAITGSINGYLAGPGFLLKCQ
jgi:hypothetical protein